MSTPIGWRIAEAHSLCEKIQDGTHFSPKEQFHQGPFPYVTAKNVRPWGLDLENLTFLDEPAHRAIHVRCDVREGDVLLVKDGVNAGDTALNTIKGEISLLSSVCFLRPESDLLAPYLRYYLQSPTGRRDLLGSLSGSAIRRIILQRIRSLPIVVAPIDEQHRIVAAIETHFSRLDAAVASLTRAKANVKRARASVLKAAVEGRLVPTEAALARAEGRDYEPASVLLDRILAEREATWAASGARGKYKEPVKPVAEGLSELPEGWVWGTPAQLSARVTVGHVGSMKSRYSQTGVPFLRSQNVRPNRFDWQGLLRIPTDFHEELEKSKVQPGDVLVVRSGSVGTACVLPEGVGEANCSDLVLIQQPKIDPSYLAYYINAGATAQVERGKVGVALTHLNTASVAALSIAVPPRAEQHRIVTEVDRRLSVLDAVDTTLDTNLARCARLRQAVLKRAFEGRLVPAEAPDLVTA